ncbi:MAG: hypothetical protein H6718_00070 [Polyangiaceae bacterium]|nr:hypothetical protein [Polyangiaceae bacterium]
MVVDPKTTRIDLEQIDEAGLRELVPMLLEKIALQDQRIAELVRMVHRRSSEKSRHAPGTLLPFAEFDELREDLEAAKKAAKTVEVPAHTDGQQAAEGFPRSPTPPDDNLRGRCRPIAVPGLR